MSEHQNEIVQAVLKLDKVLDSQNAIGTELFRRLEKVTAVAEMLASALEAVEYAGSSVFPQGHCLQCGALDPRGDASMKPHTDECSTGQALAAWKEQ